MPMPAILQGGFSPHTHIAQQLIGRRSTHPHACHVSRLLPGVTCLHESNHLPFRSTSLFLFHHKLLVSFMRDANRPQEGP